MMGQAAPLHPQLRLWDRLVALVAWSVAITLFVTVGWRALQPRDPQGAVSMLTCRRPGLMMVQMAALGVVVAALASLLIGRKLADAGVFATCLGLAVANLRGETLQPILISLADRGAATRPSLAASFLLEALVWCAIVLLAMVASALVVRWCFGRGPAAESSALSLMSVTDMPLFAAAFPADGDAKPTAERRTQLAHTLFTTAVAFALIGLFSTGAPASAIRHGQVYFAIVAGFFIAGYFAHSRFPLRTAWWTCLAVPLVTMVAYLWVMAVGSAKATTLPANLPHTVYLRALPLEYVTLGTIGSILAFWWSRHLYAARQRGAESPGGRKRQR